MPLNRLQRDFEERRQCLVDTLQKGRDGLDLSKQHQIYGAIKEIENFLKAIDHQRELLLQGEDFELLRENPKQVARQASAKTFNERTGDLFKRASIVFNERVVKKTSNAVKATKHRIRLWRDVAKEVKQREKVPPKE